MPARSGELSYDAHSVGAVACGCMQVVEVDCVLYDNQTVIKALTLQAAEASLHSPTRPVSPSARYLRLLQEGGPAKEAVCWRLN